MSEEDKNQLEHLLSVQAQFRGLFDNMVEGVVVQDPDGATTLFNPSVLTILGVTADQLSGLKPTDKSWKMINEDGSEYIAGDAPSFIAARTGLKQVDQIIGLYRGDGELRWISITAVPLFKVGSREVYQTISTIRDVTDSRMHEQQLAEYRQKLDEREKFLNTTLGALPCLVSYIDRDFHYRYVNATYNKWYGVDPTTMVGRSISDVVGEKAFSTIKPQIERSFTGEHYVCEQIIPLKRGGITYVQAQYIPDVAEDGTVKGVFAFIHDITKIKQAEISLERSESQITRILDNLPGQISYYDNRSINVHSNQPYADFFKVNAEDLRGKHIREILGEELYQKNRPFIDRVVSGEAVNFEREHPQPDGESKFFLMSYLPDMHAGILRGFFVMFTDVTHIKSLEDERRAFESKLVSASKMSSLGEMAGGIAHEINNPLAIISGRANLMQSLLADVELDRERLTKEVVKIEGTVERIAKIIRGLRAFARNADSDDAVSTSLGTVFTDTLELCQERLKNQQIEFQLEMPTPVNVICRPSQISQIFMNLVGNAIDAIDALPEKWIRIDVRTLDNKVEIEFVDSGCGIPLPVVEKMMNPFFTTKEVGKGTGLGLSISRGLAQKNGGELRYVAGRANTVFVVELPREILGSEPLPVENQAEPSAPSSTRAA